MNEQAIAALSKLGLTGHVSRAGDHSWQWWVVKEGFWKSGSGPSREAAERDMLSWLSCELRSVEAQGREG